MDSDTVVQPHKSNRSKRKLLARHFPVPAVARIVMGLLFFATGVVGILTLLGIVAQPLVPMSAAATVFAGALAKTGYMMPLISGTQTIVGLLLLMNRFVPLALAVIAPVIINILAFHAFLATPGPGPGIVSAILEIYLAWSYRRNFSPMLALRTEPTLGLNDM